DDARLKVQHVLDELLEAVGLRAEAGAGLAPNSVPAPAEVAEGDIPVGPAAGQRRLPVAGALLALDERVAAEPDAGAVLQLERRGGEGEPGRGDQGGESEAIPHEGSRGGSDQGRISLMTWPCTSVRRRSMPLWRTVSRSWSMPSRCSTVAWTSYTSVGWRRSAGL